MLSHFHQYIIILGKTTTLLLILICTGASFLTHSSLKQPAVRQVGTTQRMQNTFSGSYVLHSLSFIIKLPRTVKTLHSPLSYSPRMLSSRSHSQYSFSVPSAKYQTLIKVVFHLIQENWFKVSLRQSD